MKRISVYIVLMMIGLASCVNQPIEFPDYELRAVYFPFQLPLRTLSLGEDRIDNSLDKEGKFDIGVSIGGMYQNKWNWTVNYIIDSTLTENVYTNANPPQKVLPLPSEYYTINPINTITIPKGSFNGLVRIELNDAFFNDPISLTGLYVMPLRLISTTADSILQGVNIILNPDRRIPGHWESGSLPKDWTLYGIKYINAYHGTYLHRGKIIMIDNNTGNVIDTTIFRQDHVERDMLINLTSINRIAVVSNGLGNRIGGDYAMTLEFDNDFGKSGSIIITSAPESQLNVNGVGQYFDKESSVEQWTGLTWQSMYLEYSYEQDMVTYNIYDTLVFRDRGIKFEENKIQIIEP